MLQLQKNAMGRTSDAIVTGVYKALRLELDQPDLRRYLIFSTNCGVVSTMTGEVLDMVVVVVLVNFFMILPIPFKIHVLFMIVSST